MRPKLCLKLPRMERIEDDPVYKHLTAQGVPHEAAWTAAWIDRAYHHLLNNGLETEDAYALAKSSLHANRIDLASLTPETFITEVFIAGFKAQSDFRKLPPSHPEAVSKLAQYTSSEQGRPSQPERSKVIKMARVVAGRK